MPSQTTSRPSDEYELQSVIGTHRASLTSPVDLYQPCLITIREHDGSEDYLVKTYRLAEDMPASQANLQELRGYLERRNKLFSCWINMVGWSEQAANIISEESLGCHGCLKLKDTDEFGGPTTTRLGYQIIWVASAVFFASKESHHSSLESARFRMVLWLPSSTHGGTVITSFTGDRNLAQEISDICKEEILIVHSLGTKTMCSPWIVAFAVMRVLAEQLDIAFRLFNPLQASRMYTNIPRLHHLPEITGKASNLLRVQGILMSLEELVSFLRLSRDTVAAEVAPGCPVSQTALSSRQRDAREVHEASLTQNKIFRQQKLCTTYIKQFETLIQMSISYTAIQFSKRLDEGTDVAGRFAKMGIVIAGIASIGAPLQFLTSYYGMNVAEFTSGASISLYTFWRTGAPVLFGTVLGFLFLAVWLQAK